MLVFHETESPSLICSVKRHIVTVYGPTFIVSGSGIIFKTLPMQRSSSKKMMAGLALKWSAGQTHFNSNVPSEVLIIN